MQSKQGDTAKAYVLSDDRQHSEPRIPARRARSMSELCRESPVLHREGDPSIPGPLTLPNPWLEFISKPQQ